MKKIRAFFIIFSALLISLQTVNFVFAEETNNSVVNLSVSKYTKKDPKLITLPAVEKVDEKELNQKLLEDAKTYSKVKKSLNDEYYDMFVILDKLIRANNLHYQVWRFGIKSSLTDINACAGSANLIIVNTSLYDCLSENTDAMAYVLAHELAHLILGHGQVTLEHSIERNKLVKRYNALKTKASLYSAFGNGMSAVSCSVAANKIKKRIYKIYEQERDLEYDADREAVNLMLRAGFDPENSIEALDFMSRIPDVQDEFSTHPDTIDRIAQVKEEIDLVNTDLLINQGARKLLKTNVLEVKRSSDKRTLVISAPKKNLGSKYIPVSKEQKLLIKAYSYYRDDDYETAAKYFEKAFEQNPKNYVAPLYLSYINEYSFYQSPSKESFKKAMFWAKKALSLKHGDSNVIAQLESLKSLRNEMKSSDKSVINAD